jgi:pimeloyl-[acyl-carrier protein] methyl ester esterase
MMKLLTVHGWGFCPEVFRPLEFFPNIEHFSVDYEKTLSENARKLSQRVDEETVLIGWSMGATLSVLAASEQKPKGLILIGATPHFKRAWKGEFIEAFLTRLEKNFEKTLREFRKTAYGEDVCPLPPEGGAVGLLREFIDTDISEEVKALPAEVILLQGKRDTVVPPREAKKLLKLNPRLRLELYDGGHFPTFLSSRDWKKLLQSLR